MTASLAERKQRWLDFYSLQKPPRHLFLVRYAPAWVDYPQPVPGNMPARIERAWKRYCNQLEVMDWLDDDSLPYLEVHTGTEIFAAAFGCRVHYAEHDMPFALPLIHSAGEVDSLEIPGLDHPQLACLFQMADELRKRAGGEALLHIVDLQSPMDVAALIWEKKSFFTAMIQTPDAIHALAEKVKQLQIRFLDEWFRRYGREFIAHYPDYYMPYGITFSVDEVGAVSSGMFRRFFLPELVDLSQRYGAIGIHCCANARHQWQNFKQVPNLRLININQPLGVTLESMEVFKHTCVQWPVVQEGAVWDMNSPVPEGVRTVFDLWATSRDEALRMVERYRAFEMGAL